MTILSMTLYERLRWHLKRRHDVEITQAECAALCIRSRLISWHRIFNRCQRQQQRWAAGGRSKQHRQQAKDGKVEDKKKWSWTIVGRTADVGGKYRVLWGRELFFIMLISKRPAGNWVQWNDSNDRQNGGLCCCKRDAIVSDKKNLTGILMNVVQEHVH